MNQEEAQSLIPKKKTKEEHEANICLDVSMLLCFSFIPTICFIATSYVIAVQNIGLTCDSRSPIALSSWLFTFASYSIFQLIIIGIALFLYLRDDDSSQKYEGSNKSTGPIIMMIAIFPGLFFNGFWNVVGWFISLAYSRDCFYQSGFFFVIITLFYQWFWIILHVYYCIKLKRSINL